MKHVVVGIIGRTSPAGETEYLLTTSTRDFGGFTGAYYPPGGHLEEGEDEKTALLREIREELGIEVEPVAKMTETGADVPDQTTHWWRCRIVKGEITPNKKQVALWGWYTKKQALALTLWPMVRKVFEKYL